MAVNESINQAIQQIRNVLTAAGLPEAGPARGDGWRAQFLVGAGGIVVSYSPLYSKKRVTKFAARNYAQDYCAILRQAGLRADLGVSGTTVLVRNLDES